MWIVEATLQQETSHSVTMEKANKEFSIQSCRGEGRIENATTKVLTAPCQGALRACLAAVINANFSAEREPDTRSELTA